MSAIVQIPGSLSLVGNIQDIIVNSAAQVAFKIILSGNTIVDENHTPDETGNVTIKLRRMLAPFLHSEIPTANVFEQANAAKVFTFDIDGVQTVCTVVGAGVNASIDAGVFLRTNWLTWQPQQKQVKYTDPEWLSYYAVEAVTVKLKAYFFDGSSQTITLASLTAGKFYSLNVNFQYITGLVAGQPVYFDLWTEDATAVRLSFIQRYVLIADQFEFDDLFVFANSLGGIDTIRFTGNKAEENTFEISSGLINDEQTIDYDVDQTYFFAKNTGFFRSLRERSWINEFLNSTTRLHVDPEGLLPITVSEPKAEVDPGDPETFFYEFKFALSRQTKYLNFERAMELPENVEVIDPNSELFFFSAQAG